MSAPFVKPCLANARRTDETRTSTARAQISGLQRCPIFVRIFLLPQESPQPKRGFLTTSIRLIYSRSAATKYVQVKEIAQSNRVLVRRTKLHTIEMPHK